MKVTTDNLHYATEQQVFDTVAKHLLKQNKASMIMSSIDALSVTKHYSYRGPNGLKCAAGCLITDDIYNKNNVEGVNWLNLVERKLVPKHHCNLICALQIVHDLHPPNLWKEKLKDVAEKFDLNIEVLKK